MGPEYKPVLPKIFADTSKISEIEGLVKIIPIHGITTNPVIVGKEAGDDEPIDYYKRLAQSFPNLPVSVQLLDEPPDVLIEQAHLYSSISQNIIIKVPMFADGRGLIVLSQLAKEGIKTNVTAMMNTEQLFLALYAANTGPGLEPTYLSLFFNRIRDSGGDPEVEISRSRALLEKFGWKSEIITGSIRRGKDVLDAIMAGAHIVTVQPKVIWEMVSHPKSIEFIQQSQDAWNQLLAQSKGNNHDEQARSGKPEKAQTPPQIATR